MHDATTTGLKCGPKRNILNHEGLTELSSAGSMDAVRDALRSLVGGYLRMRPRHGDFEAWI